MLNRYTSDDRELQLRVTDLFLEVDQDLAIEFLQQLEDSRSVQDQANNRNISSVH